MKLSKIEAITLSKLKAKNKDYTVADGGGLSLLIKADNKKLWEFRYTSPITLKRRKTSLGLYPTVSLKVARDKAKEFRELIAQEIDPIDSNKFLSIYLINT